MIRMKKTYFESRAEAKKAVSPFLPAMRAAFGPGWRLRIWDNPERCYHVEIRKDYWSVHFYPQYKGKHRWSAGMHSSPEGAGIPGHWYEKDVGWAADPVTAMRQVLDHMHKIMAEDVRLYCAMEDSILGPKADPRYLKKRRKWLVDSGVEHAAVRGTSVARIRKPRASRAASHAK